MTSSAPFDESDLKSYYYGKDVTYEDAEKILKDQESGVFLVRDSSARGGYVICIKDGEEVKQYPVHTKDESLFIREEYTFKDLAALLSFYKRNLFTSTALIRPVSMDRVRLHQRTTVGQRKTMITDNEMRQQDPMGNSHKHQQRASAPPGMTCPPAYAKVVKARTPISYNLAALTLKVGDIIRVTKRKDGQGHGELVATGQSGSFPLTHVEFIDSLETLQ